MDPGTVHAIAPLTVLLDGSATEQPAVNMSSISLAIGTRVDIEPIGPDTTSKQLHVVAAATHYAGEVIFGAWAATPPGTLACDGASYARTAYPALSAALGGGGTTFTVPNMPTGTFPASGTPGTSGGAATHTLSTTEMPSHNHTQDAHNHTQSAHGHTENPHTHVQNLGGSLSTVAPVSGSYVVGNANTSGTAAATAGINATTATNTATTATNQANGGGVAFPIVPLFAGFRFVIKT